MGKLIILTIHEYYTRFQEYINVFFFFLALFALSNNGFDTSEGRMHYQVALQIVQKGQLGFDTLRPGIFGFAPNGRVYAGHELGNTLFMLPTALLNVWIQTYLSAILSPKIIENLTRFILSFQAGVYSAITATAFFAISRNKFHLQHLFGFLSTFCLVITTYFWTYSRNLFDGVLCCMLLTVSFFFLVTYGKEKKEKYLIFSFFSLGFAFITRISMILAIVASLVYLLTYRASVSIKVREFCLAILTLLPFWGWQSWYNHLRTGIFYLSPVQTGYAGNNALDGDIIAGLTGLMLSPGKSLFVYAPLLIISLVLFKRFYKSYPKEAIYIVTIAVLWFLLHAKLRSWYGAWGWGPRHFITILPVLFLPFAVQIEYVLQNFSLKILSIILASFGFVLSLSSIISNWHVRMHNAKDNGFLSDSIFVWGFWNCQSVDMIRGSVSNILRIFSYSPITANAILDEAYPQAYIHASNTFNIWPAYLIYTGIPWYVVLVLLLPLIILLYFTARNIFTWKPEEIEHTTVPPEKHTQ